MISSSGGVRIKIMHSDTNNFITIDNRSDNRSLMAGHLFPVAKIPLGHGTIFSHESRVIEHESPPVDLGGLFSYCG
jgi:hypothetical protein